MIDNGRNDFSLDADGGREFAKESSTLLLSTRISSRQAN